MRTGFHIRFDKDGAQVLLFVLGVDQPNVSCVCLQLGGTIVHERCVLLRLLLIVVPVDLEGFVGAVDERNFDRWAAT